MGRWWGEVGLGKYGGGVACDPFLRWWAALQRLLVVTRKPLATMPTTLH